MENQIGRIGHFYNRISVAVLLLTDKLNVGDKIHIIGHTTDFVQEVTSMEIEHKKVSSGSPEDQVALKVNEPVKKGDAIYKIIEESL
ncbi:MAG: translation elongation factor-like protein [Chloroflexota bacterium]|nr:translation elongation factor-like protein [Chloroflexota bacterium]